LVLTRTFHPGLTQLVDGNCAHAFVDGNCAHAFKVTVMWSSGRIGAGVAGSQQRSDAFATADRSVVAERHQ
jgi:hypothetical protein